MSAIPTPQQVRDAASDIDDAVEDFENEEITLEEFYDRIQTPLLHVTHAALKWAHKEETRVYQFKEIHVDIPDHDADVVITFPNGQSMTIQARPSNADDNYNGSLDIILPENMEVTNWFGDDMQPAAPCDPADPCTLLTKQLVMELPGITQPLET